MVTLKSENRVFDTVTHVCFNSCLLKLVWYDRLVMRCYGDLKLAIFKIVLANLKSENMVFGKLSLWCELFCIKVCMEIIVQHMGHVTL